MTIQEKNEYLKQFSVGKFYTIAVTNYYSSCGTTYEFVTEDHQLTTKHPNLGGLVMSIKFKDFDDAYKTAVELQNNGILPQRNGLYQSLYNKIEITPKVASYIDKYPTYISIIEVTDEMYLKSLLGKFYDYLANGADDNYPKPKFNMGDTIWYFDNDGYMLYKDIIEDAIYEPIANCWYYKFGIGMLSRYISENFCVNNNQVRSVLNIPSNYFSMKCSFDEFKMMRNK